MRRITNNIGLENNPNSVETIINHLTKTLNFRRLKHFIDVSTYKGETEKTLVIQAETGLVNYGIKKLFHFVICRFNNQESIAYRIDGEPGVLMFSSIYRGETFPFD